jgi:hypothetical protein
MKPTTTVGVGRGTRLLPDTGSGAALELVDSRATPRVTIQVHRSTGRSRYATAWQRCRNR